MEPEMYAMSPEGVITVTTRLKLGTVTAEGVRKLADQIVGTGATVQDIASRIIKSGELGTLDGMHIVKIPDSWMPENVLYMIVAKSCCVAPKKIETLRVIENHPDIDGHVVQGRILHDCFVLEKKAGGILVAKSSAT